MSHGKEIFISIWIGITTITSVKLVASDEVENGPYPDMAQKMMRHLGIVNAEEVAKIGDTEVD